MELTPYQAARIVRKSDMFIYRKVRDGFLKAHLEGTGKKRRLKIDVEELRRFCETYGYAFDEALARQFSEK